MPVKFEETHPLSAYAHGDSRVRFGEIEVSRTVTAEQIVLDRGVTGRDAYAAMGHTTVSHRLVAVDLIRGGEDDFRVALYFADEDE